VDSITFKGSAARVRGVWFALAFVAVGLLLLRPLCEFAFAGVHAAVAAERVVAAQASHGDQPAETCCSSVKDGTLVKPAHTLSLGGVAGALGVALLLVSGFPRSPVRTPQAGFALAPSSGRSYCSRSARILR
jgi:hypothetical protein